MVGKRATNLVMRSEAVKMRVENCMAKIDCWLVGRRLGI